MNSESISKILSHYNIETNIESFLQVVDNQLQSFYDQRIRAEENDDENDDEDDELSRCFSLFFVLFFIVFSYANKTLAIRYIKDPNHLFWLGLCYMINFSELPNDEDACKKIMGCNFFF